MSTSKRSSLSRGRRPIQRFQKRMISNQSLLAGLKHGFRSGLEEAIGLQHQQLGIPVRFEEVKLRFIQPSKWRTYTPDFILPNGIIIESKGRFLSGDRQKHLWIQKQHPNMDIRFIFSNSNQRISKQSKTTYRMWCQKNGFMFADKLIPEEWIKEPPRKYLKQLVKGAKIDPTNTGFEAP